VDGSGDLREAAVTHQLDRENAGLRRMPRDCRGDQGPVPESIRQRKALTGGNQLSRGRDLPPLSSDHRGRGERAVEQAEVGLPSIYRLLPLSAKSQPGIARPIEDDGLASAAARSVGDRPR
jgi:hypothetical protein